MQSITAIILLVLIIVSFATQIIPLPLTAVLGSLLMMMTGIITPAEAISSFGSDTVLMVVGVMIIGQAVFETGLAERIGYIIIRFKPASKNEKVFLLVVLFVVSLLSAFMSNTAAVAIFMPLVASVVKVTQGRITKKNTYMAMGVASILGGNCTLAGSTPQLVAQGILATTQGVRTLTFFELGKVAIPMLGLMLLYYGTIGYPLQKKVFNFPDVEDNIRQSTSVIKRGYKDILSGCILLSCIAGFIFGVFSMGTVALLGGCACILTGCISQKRAFETMDWNTVIVLGGAMGFAKGMNASGAVDIITVKLIELFGGASANPAFLCAALIIISAILGNVMSHTATAAVMTPLCISTGLTLGSNPITFVIAVIIGANLSFATPVGTPPLTMTLPAGYRFMDYVKVGGTFNIIAVVFAMLTIPIIYGL